VPERGLTARRLKGTRILLPGLAAILLAACASGLSVRSDEDPSANFAAYQTWDFFEQLGIEGGYNSPVYGEHFRAAISREMNQRGYRRSSEPDLLVNVTIQVDKKVRMTAYTAPYLSGAYYHQPGGPYYGSALGVGVGVGSRATETTQASVFIDLVDNSRDRMVWQGVAVIDANDKVAQQLRDAIYTSVNEVFKQYSHSAAR
jgi:hypothetical protein